MKINQKYTLTFHEAYLLPHPLPQSCRYCLCCHISETTRHKTISLLLQFLPCHANIFIDKIHCYLMYKSPTSKLLILTITGRKPFTKGNAGYAEMAACSQIIGGNHDILFIQGVYSIRRIFGAGEWQMHLQNTWPCTIQIRSKHLTLMWSKHSNMQPQGRHLNQSTLTTAKLTLY